jgi:hypothetical protein
MTINPRTNKTTEGRYRNERYVSAFSKKSSAPKAFMQIAEKSKLIGSKLVVSYSSNSIVTLSNLLTILKKSYSNVYVEKIPFQHSKQGRKSLSEVTEYLIVCI